MKKTHRTLAAAVLALAVARTAAAQAGDGGGAGHPGRQGRWMARVMDALDLTDAQRQKVQPLLDEHQGAIAPLREKMRGDRQALRNAMEAAQPDATTVGRAMLALKANRDGMKAQRDALRTKLAKVLTPEQNAKLDGYFAGLRAGRRMGMRPPR